MNNHFKSMSLLFSVVLCAAISASALAGPSYICHHYDSTREIEVVYELDGQSVPCKVVYRKAEGEQTLWTAQAEEGYCEDKAAAFAAKQEGWGWQCADNASAEDTAEDEVINADDLSQFETEAETESAEVIPTADQDAESSSELGAE